MTFRELTDYIMDVIGSQKHIMSEQVPDDVADMIRGELEHIDPVEYLAEKYDIGGGDI